MLLFVVAYVGGVLTIFSPCILPVVPFVFARADRSFARTALPTCAGMAIAFCAIATLAAVGGNWAIEANKYGRFAAMAILALFGLFLLLPALSDRLLAPAAALGGRLSQSIERPRSGGEPRVLSSLLLGAATGLLWAPCAGPILGLILTGAALEGANLRTSSLLLAYGAGAATSLALAVFAGGRVFAFMKRTLGAGEWIRRGLGLAVLGGVAAIALGFDTGVLTQLSLAGTTTVEQKLLDRVHVTPAAQPTAMMAPPAMAMTGTMSGGAMSAAGAMTAGTAQGARSGVATLDAEGQMPSLDGATTWLNSPPLTADALRGKVVVVDFWTYSCINCLRAIPYVRAWAEKYAAQGLVVIGVHSPEFAFEKNLDNVRQAVADLQIRYPVAVDNQYAIWRAFGNQYWPAHYFVDATGRIRHHHFGEGEYDESEHVIQQLLAERGTANVPGGLVAVHASGAEAASSEADVQSPETYIGYERAERFVSPGGVAENAKKTYADGQPRLNEWGLTGEWIVSPQQAALVRPDGGITYRFHARDLHLVLGTSEGKPVRFKVTLDGAPPGDAHGVDTDANGTGVVTGQRLYQLIRQSGSVRDRTFEITFLDAGVQAYAFTFG
ncbi:MAG TPA: cytochrome c biogenesis protein DipZ [Vicinamibacterales bacterium]|jgi:cytochrome c biogenesis protein CcdA/thiol-disulfide isomerase/thioredoxin